mmetsp:Transcript_5976/g.15229  ORF Transcript_5976/g.15229 Transcript_5976/m.15229 type:complete len:870 (+) Transcript_5976:19-2628(+)
MFKKDDDVRGNPYSKMDKTTVMQESRTFNNMPLKPRACIITLSKIMYLLLQGESIAPKEATECFFAMTKLFQSQHVTLRKMMYLVIKGMASIADDVIIVTSSLTKDMTGKNEQFRAGAIRALTTITDPAMLQSIERYYKQSLVDQNPAVASAALVSSLHLMKDSHDVVKRWVNEVSQALDSKGSADNMVQYHALGVLYHIKQKDPLAVMKLVTGHIRGNSLRSRYATCLLIRYASKVMDADPDGQGASEMYDFLESCLRHPHEMVVSEAARAIINLKNVTARELEPAVNCLNLFLSSSKSTIRFAAVRTLNRIAISHPAALKGVAFELENLITDPNRSIATLAITTLLKTGNESSLDRLLKQMNSFISEVSDEFKVVVVNAIKSLCLKFPKKHATTMGFLSNVLRDEGGFEYKKAVVETILNIITHVEEAQESGLEHLCEFIEDCEFPSLLVQILHLLGEQGPRTASPRKYIRFVYNRLILENATVRAAAISALARFGSQCESLRPSVLVLLKRSLVDSDDEVRDRATLCIELLEAEEEAAAPKILLNKLPQSMKALESMLIEYTGEEVDTTAPFDVKSVPLGEADVVASKNDDDDFAEEPGAGAAPVVDDYREQLGEIEAFREYGPLFRSCKPASLSAEEYQVKCIKHIYENHVVLQFNLLNTLNDQMLENVELLVDKIDGEPVTDEEFTVVPATVMKYNEPTVAYTAFEYDSTDVELAINLSYVVKDLDPDTGEVDEEGYPDVYQIEDLTLTMADFMMPLDKPNFAAAWKELDDADNQEGTFSLPQMADIEEAVVKICGLFGMKACERSDRVKAGKNTHVLYLAGMFVGGFTVLARARLAFDEDVTLKFAVRSENEDLTSALIQAFE